MPSKVDELLIEVQRLGIEFEELHKERTALQEAVQHNAKLYRDHTERILDLIEATGAVPSPLHTEVSRLRERGIEELKTLMEVQHGNA